MWQRQPIEYSIQKILAERLGENGNVYFSKYISTRDEFCSEVLTYISSTEPTLTDHGVDHIANVFRNIWLLLGFKDEIESDFDVDAAMGVLKPKEFLLILLCSLVHDIGNIQGRSGHNEMAAEVWKRLKGACNQWTESDFKTVCRLCRAHTGVAEDGSSNTLAPLKADRHYFLGDPVRGAELAALLRYGDELAEGPQRTSKYLRMVEGYPSDSMVFHDYAAATHLNIDTQADRVAVSYDIDVSDEAFGGTKSERKRRIKQLLSLCLTRAAKLDRERQLCRHYAPGLIGIVETSISFGFSSQGREIMTGLAPVVLNDINMNGVGSKKLSDLDPSYKVTTLLKAAFEE